MRPTLVARLGIPVVLAALAACTRWEVVPVDTTCRPPRPLARVDSAERSAGRTLAGRVVDDEDGASVAYAVIWLRPVGADSLRWREVRSDSAGRFEASVESPGRWALRAMHVAFWARVDTLDVAEGSTRRIVLPLARLRCDPDFGIALVSRKPWWKFW